MFVKHALAEVEKRARNAINTLSQSETVTGAFLFGSYVSGSADKWSDIDIAVFIEGAEFWSFQKRVKTSSRISRIEGDIIELHFFPASDLTQADPASFAAYVLKHGLPIPLPQNQLSEKLD